jgi:hypothetical protein
LITFLSSDNIRSAEEYSLSWSLRGPSTLDVTSTQEGSNWRTTIAGADTADLAPGAYQVWGFLVDGDDERTTVYCGQVLVKANPADVTDPYDPRTEAKKTLDAINATIKARAEGGVSNYSIEGRSATYFSLDELLKLRDKYTWIVRQEEVTAAAAQGLPNPNRLRVRFY